MIEAAPNAVVRIYFALKDVGLGGLSGEAPTIVIRRKRDALYLQSAAGLFGGAGIKIPMVEVDAANRPGLYSFDFDLGTSDPDATDEYTAYMANDNIAVPAKNGSALDVIHVKNEQGWIPGATRGVYLFIANAGSPLGATGFSPEVSIARESDGRHLDTSLPDFVTGPAIFNPMSEIDVSNQPGVYFFDFDQSVDGEIRRYIAYIRELNTPTKIIEATELDFSGVEELPAGGLTFAGIETLIDNGLGCMTAGGSVVESPYPPVRYKVFVARESQIAVAADLFVEAFLVGEFKIPVALICFEADLVTPLLPLTRYTVGMRVLDARAQEDDNEETLTVEVTASSRLRLSTGALRNLSTVSTGGDSP